jgi:hypothetical protein
VPAKICCVTGHRAIPQNQQKHVESELRSLIIQAIFDGFDTFLSGFAAGVDYGKPPFMRSEKLKGV